MTWYELHGDGETMIRLRDELRTVGYLTLEDAERLAADLQDNVAQARRIKAVRRAKAR